jgi:hypothetical protein
MRKFIDTSSGTNVLGDVRGLVTAQYEHHLALTALYVDRSVKLCNPHPRDLGSASTGKHGLGLCRRFTGSLLAR